MSIHDDEDGFKERNRLRARQASKRGLFWCDICDRDIVGDYGKCPNCGATKGRKIRYDRGNTGFSHFT